VPVPERVTQVYNPPDEQASRPGILATVFGFVIGIIAGVFMSRNAATVQRSGKR
jgi:hypothetical protein